MLKQISIIEALNRFTKDDDVKVLVPKGEDAEWGDYQVMMLSQLFEGVIFLADGAPVHVREETVKPKDDIVFADEPPIETDDTKPETAPDGKPVEYVSVPCVAPMDEESEAEPKPVKKPGPKKDIDDGKIRALFETGHWTVADIADEMGISQATVYNHLKKMGVDLTK